jgi:hypothetical protein
MAETMGYVQIALKSRIPNMISPIASAVVLPDPLPSTEPGPSPSAKRRLSSEHDEPSKRPRTSSEQSTNPSLMPLKTSPEPTIKKEKLADKPINHGPERRKVSVQEERKRGQRLFGGLLSTLSQTTPNSQAKRRLEIEKRQQEKAKLQKAEDDRRRARKREDLVTTRKTEQAKFEEASVCYQSGRVLQVLIVG